MAPLQGPVCASWSLQPGWPQRTHGRPLHTCREGASRDRPSLDGAPEPARKAFGRPPKPGQRVPRPLPSGWLRPGYLNGPQLHLRGAALHVAVVAAAGAALHLHAGRPHQEVGVGAVYEAPRDLKHLGACLALGDHGWLSDCWGTWRERGPPSGW